MMTQPRLPEIERVGETAERMLTFIVAWKIAHDGNSPSLRQIAAGLDLGSGSTAFHHLQALIDAGHLVRTEYGYRVPGGEWRVAL